MIELTREQALTILRHISNIEGYLMRNVESHVYCDLLSYTVELLAQKLDNDEQRK